MAIDKNLSLEYNFIGNGWAFRPGQGIGVNGQGGIALMQGEDDVAKSIFIILSTAKGERVMRPDFGCGVHDLVFASIGPQLYGLISYHIQQDLGRWEPRIEVTDVITEPDPDMPERLIINIFYRIKSTNSSNNLVFPFYTIPRNEE